MEAGNHMYFVGAPSGTIWYHRHVCVFVSSCHVTLRVLWRALDQVLYCGDIDQSVVGRPLLQGAVQAVMQSWR